MARRVVVAGAGLAAVHAVQALREAESEAEAGGTVAEVVLVGDERVLPYDRPPLSKHVLRGERPVPPLLTEDDVARLRLDVRLGAPVRGLQDGRVLLDDGSDLAYDALLVATGAAPRTLPGLAGPDVHVLRTAGDAEALRAAVRSAGRLTVVGAGLVGCEAAASARALGAEVVLLEVLDQPVLRSLGPVAAEHVAAAHRAAGVDLRCGTSVLEVEGDRGSRRLHLSDGTVVDGGPLLVAVGAAPATGWLAGSGVAVDDGVLCGADGRTSVPGVWAAGDVARWQVPSQGRTARIEHWTSAAEQGDVVGRQLAGGPAVEHDPVPYVWSEQYGVRWEVVGLPAAADDHVVLRVGPRQRLLVLHGREGRLTGAVGAGVPRQVARVRELLAGGGGLDEAEAAVGARLG